MFRHNLAPEQLKEILQKRAYKDAEDKLEQKAEDGGVNEKQQNHKDTDRTAGQGEDI